MRLSDFWRLMDDEFGSARGRMLVESQALSGLGSVTGAEALEQGVPVRDIWAAVCEEMQVPPERRWGKERPRRR
ncbi:Protein of unknown function [Austwickia chelonae]|nr:DUF3046 domain-containing protein [Austwickia chelonae]SEW08213.1 Protein of unknown function [Austwickia chelonae]